MSVLCIDKKTEWFKDTYTRLGITADQLELSLFKYYNELGGDPNTSPSDETIIEIVSEENSNIMSSPLENKKDKKIIYNKEQEEAISAVINHIKTVRSGKAKNNFYTIQGKAGTGKTTIVSEILKRLDLKTSRFSKRPVVIAGALAWEATNVLSKKINTEEIKSKYKVEAKTIAGMLGMRPSEDGSTFIKDPKVTTIPIKEASVVFIDEASMVNEEQLDTILDVLQNSQIPIIFLGDIGQLPPIRESAYYKSGKGKNIAEDAASPIFTTPNIGVSKLTTRVRQGESSPVLDYADGYWEFSQEKRDSYPYDLKQKSKVTDQGALIIQRNNVNLVEQLLPLFREAIKNRNPNLVKIVAFRSTDKDSKESAISMYNRLVREALFPNFKGDGFTNGDLIRFDSAFGENGEFNNGLVGSIITASQILSKIPARFPEVEGLEKVEYQEVVFEQLDGTQSMCLMLVPTRKNKAAFRSNINKIAKWIKELPTAERGVYWGKFFRYKDNTYANVGFAYAINSHKSQGSTYEVVAVDAGDINTVKPTSLKTKARSMYTAITRASNVTIVHSNTTNDATIYTDIKGINDRIKAVKNGTATEEYYEPETEENDITEVDEDDLSNLIIDPDSKSKRGKKTSNRKVEEIDDLDGEIIDGEIIDDGNEKSWEDLGTDKEESKKGKKKTKLTPQEQSHQKFVTVQKQVNSITKFKKESHTYHINGKQADYSVTQFRDFLLMKKVSKNTFLEIASRLGTTHDSIFRDYFMDNVQDEYENMSKKDINKVVKQAQKLKEALEEAFLSESDKKAGKKLIFITDENLLKVAGKVSVNGKTYTIAGTMDMVVIDTNGGIHVVDFKTKRTNINKEFSNDDLKSYGLQTYLYKELLNSYELLEGTIKTTKLAKINLKYADPRDYKYSFEKDQIYATIDGIKVKIQEANEFEKNFYTSGEFDKLIPSIIKLKSGLLGFEPIKTITQQLKEGKKVSEETSIAPKRGTGKELGWYGDNYKLDGIKSVSTLYAIKEGKRTAATRIGSITDNTIRYYIKFKAGDIITFSDRKGNKVTVRITVPLHRLNADLDVEEWCKKEGYNEEYFKEHILPNIKKAWQMEFELYKEEDEEDEEREKEEKKTNKEIKEEVKNSRKAPKKEEETTEKKGKKEGEKKSEALLDYNNQGYTKRGNKQIKISTEGYKKGDPQENPTIAYVFTENAQAAANVYDDALGYEEEVDSENENVRLKVSDVKGTNQAGIRTDNDGNLTKNAFGIVTKKRQQDSEGHWLKKGGQFEDTDKDFEIFKAYNERFFKSLEGSGLKKIMLPSQMALGKSALPYRFAEWLQNELLNRLGVDAEIVENENSDYNGYGLNLKGIHKEDKKAGLHLERTNKKYSPKNNSDYIGINLKAGELRKNGWNVEFYNKTVGEETTEVMVVSDEDPSKKNYFEVVTSGTTYSINYVSEESSTSTISDRENMLKAALYALPDESIIIFDKNTSESQEVANVNSQFIIVKTADDITDETNTTIYKKISEEEAIKRRMHRNKRMQTKERKKDYEDFNDDYFSITQSTESDERFTGIFSIVLKDSTDDSLIIDITDDSKNYALKALIKSLPYSSVVTLSTENVNANFLHTLNQLLNNPTLYAYYDGTYITIDPQSEEGMMYASHYADEGKLRYDKETGKLYIPKFTVGFKLEEIIKKAQRSKLVNSHILTQRDIRSLSKAAMYKVSEYITKLQTYSNYAELLFNENEEELIKDYTGMSRIDILKTIGLHTLLNKVKEKVFNSEFAASNVSFDTLDKMDLIAENWQAFIEFGYDSLINLEEVALNTNQDFSSDIKNDQNNLDDENSDNTEVIQELFGDSVEHWQVGFRQLSAINSLSQLIKRKLDSLYVMDKDGIITNELGIGEHLNLQEAVAKILHYTQGAESLDATDSEGNLRKNSMIYLLKEQLNAEPWLQQVIDLLEDKIDDEGNITKKSDEQFKSQFFSNFKKYFQKYAITYKDQKGNVLTKVINEHEHADTLLNESRVKEASFALGAFNLKTKEGKINKVALKELTELAKKIDIFTNKAIKKGKLKDLINLDEYHKTLKEVFNILDITTPADELLWNLFGVKENLKRLNKKLYYLLDNIEEGITITNIKDYKDIVALVAKTSDLDMESMSYEAGKMYYSYVMPSYLGRLVTKLKSENMSQSEYQEFLQNEYFRYKWFYKNGKIRNRWLKRLAMKTNTGENLRRQMQHVVSLSYMGNEYTKKTPAEYIASMIRMYFYEQNNNYAYFRVPTLSNKPSEEYIKFEKITVGYRETIADYMWDVFMQELDRIQAVEERRGNTNKDQKIENFDKNGSKFLFTDYLQKYADGTYSQRNEFKDLTEAEQEEEKRFSELLEKKIAGELKTNNSESAELIKLFKTITQRAFDENYQNARKQWVKEGFITLDENGKIKKILGNLKYGEDKLKEFFWNDAFAAIQILQLTITDLAYYKNAEDLQKRFAQIHAPGMYANINARDSKGNLYTADGISRTMYIKDSIVKSESLDNLKLAIEKIIETSPEERKPYLRRSLQSILKAFQEINWADSQGFSCPTSYRKKMAIFGNWGDREEEAYQMLIHPEEYPNAKVSDLIDVLWQPLKPFVYTQISKNGYNNTLPELKVGVQNKNSEYVLIMADALLRRAGMPNKLKAIYEFMEDSQRNPDGTLNGKGIDTIQFESTAKVGKMGVIDLNDKTEEEIKTLLGQAYKFDENGNRVYNQDYVHEIPFEDYMIQQNVPAHFRGHYQAQGSQNRALIFADVLDVDPVTGKENILIIDGHAVTVKKAKENYFKAIADNIKDSEKRLIQRFKLDALDQRDKNIALSRMLKEQILKDGRFGADMLWAVDVNEFGEFNIPLSDPIHSNRIQQLLNSIIKNTINKQEIAGGPVVQVSSWGVSDDLYIRYKNKNGELLVSKREFESKNLPKDYNNTQDGKRMWKSIDGYETYDQYIADQYGLAFMEAYVPIQDANIVKDFTKVDENGNEYIDTEAMRKANPHLLEMIGYRIPTESKYSMIPIKVKGFLPLRAGEVVMLPAEITTMSGSDFDIDKLYMMRYSFIRVTDKKGNIKYLDPTEGKAARDNLIISTQLAVLKSSQVQPQLFTPGNFDEPKKLGYLINYVQTEAERTGKDVTEIYNEAKEWGTSELKDRAMASKNLIWNNVQVQFHKQNMTAGKLIGIFAQANVSHAFISYKEDTPIIIDNEYSFTLNDVYVGGSFQIDPIFSLDRESFVSNKLASLLAASVDAVKDPILNLININDTTANFVTSLLRMGFDLETVALLCSQPVIQELISDYGIKKAENEGNYVDINTIIENKINSLPKDLRSIKEIRVTKEDLIENLTGDAEVTSYMVLQIFNRMRAISTTFMDVTHMTKFNSISSAVGPSASDTIIARRKTDAFRKNKMITPELAEAVENPILANFRDSADTIEQQLLGLNFIQASAKYAEALNKLGERLGFNRGVSSKTANAFSNFYMSYYVNSNSDGSVFDLSFENRKYMLTQFPTDFLKIKKTIKDNSFINSIRYVESDRESFPFLQLKTRGMSSENLESLKIAWSELFENPETNDLAVRLVEYCFFRGSFGFSPKTFMSIVPSIIKTNLNNYISTLNNRDNVVETDTFINRVINQFIQHNSYLINEKYSKLEEYNPKKSKDSFYGDTIILNREKGEGEKGSKIAGDQPFVIIDNKLYFVVDKSNNSLIILKEVDKLGGKQQGFEIDPTINFPKTVFEEESTEQEEPEEEEENPTKDIKIDPELIYEVAVDTYFRETYASDPEDALELLFIYQPPSEAFSIFEPIISKYRLPEVSNLEELFIYIKSSLSYYKDISNSYHQILNESELTLKDLNLC